MASGAVEYHLEDGSEPEAALEGLLEVVREPSRTVERTYYDTFDGRLHGDGLTLVWERGRLAVLDRGDGTELASAELDEPPDRLPAVALPGGRLASIVGPVIDVRTLLAIARTTGSEQRLRVRNADDKTVVRLAVERPAVLADGRPASALPTRLRVVPVRGYEKALRQVTQRLERELGLTPVEQPLQDEAVLRSGGRPGGASSKPSVALQRDQRADSAVTALLVQLLDAIEANLPGTLEDVDSEFLHDFRVAVRRTRTAQRQLKRVFPPEPLERFRAEFRRLQQVTGPTRDLDVHLHELDELLAMVPEHVRGDLAPLGPILERRRAAERRSMERSLRAKRTRSVLADWSALLEDLVLQPEDDRPDATRPIHEVAGRRIAKVYRRMVKDGSAIDASSPPEALHELRKTGKELRYLLEFFAPLFPGKVTKPMIKSLKALQDTLGRHQDRAVQAEMLRALRDDVAAAPDGPAALLALGLLIDRLEQDQGAARGEFADRFAAFGAKRQQTLVEKTFR